MRTQFNKEFVPVQQKGRRVPVQLQERVEKKEKTQQAYGSKTHKSPIVITIKKRPDGEISVGLKKDQ